MSVPPPLAVTMGEPAGIGGDIALAAWVSRERSKSPCFFVIDDADRLRRLAVRLGMDVPITTIDQPENAIAHFAAALPVLHRPLAKAVEPGQPDPITGTAVTSSIAEAVRLAMDKRVGAVVTNPIHKAVLYAAGFAFPGHTEYLAALAGASKVVMMLVADGLRVVPVTIHVSLVDAVAKLTTALIVDQGRLTAAALVTDFGIPAPRLAVAGVNPHAGEDGAMGREDIDVVAPAVAALRAAGIDAAGPLPADTMFHPAARALYDAALCMYHDQALIPLKTLDFFGGVNVTLGLPFIRTSPDHGTAFELAGTGKAKPDSLIAALKLAGEMAARRG
jgi:4-hydroxythreonine-4-phosphate dehydrogenase